MTAIIEITPTAMTAIIEITPTASTPIGDNPTEGCPRPCHDPCNNSARIAIFTPKSQGK
jgi:hypothetical protein